MNENNTVTNEQRLNPKFESLPDEFVYKDTLWTQGYSVETIQKIENDFKFYPDDVLIATYPKSGTTLLQEIAWLIGNDANTDLAKSKLLIQRSPFLDLNIKYDYDMFQQDGFVIDFADSLPRPRFLKTHLTFRNLEQQINKNPKMKILVTLRNPKDNAVSLFHFYRGLVYYGPYKGTWDEFFERWIDGWVSGGDWLRVTSEWWNERFRKNIKIIFFEDLIYKKKQMIIEICEFLNKNLSENQIETIIKHTEFQKMKVNPKTNYSLFKEFDNIISKDFQFIRKGEVGDWKNYFSEEQNRRCTEKYDSVLEKIGLKLQYE